MRLVLPQILPGLPLKGVYGIVSLAATDDGLVTVGHSLRCLTTFDQLAMGAEAPRQHEDALKLAQDVLEGLWVAEASLLDLPPFP